MTTLGLSRGDWRLVGAGAILTALAYPPFHLFVPSFLALVPAVWLITDAASEARPARRLLLQGFWYGFLGQGLVLYWMVIALWHFTELSALGFLTTIAILGLFWGVVFALSDWITRRSGVSVVWVFPLVWTAMDWWIGHLADVRFPWLGLGTSLTGFPTLVQVADVVGARGVTFLLALANAGLAQAWIVRRNQRRAGAAVAAVAAGVAAAALYGVVRERTLVVREVGTIAVLQPNAAAGERWDPRSKPAIFDDLLALSERAMAADVDLVVWPEAAVPDNFYSRPAWRERISAHAVRHARPVVVGALDFDVRSRDEYDYFNAAFLFDSTGNSRGPVYHKRYLVPITERVPFMPPEWFGKLEFFGGFSPGREGPVYRVEIGRFGVLICFESVFEDLSRRYRRDGAEFLVNITNDAWFGRTSAPYQHAAHLVMRAIENRVGIARAANTGISGFVDPVGRTHQRTPLYVQAVETRRLVTTDVVPLYVRLGDWVGGGAVAATFLLVGFAWRRR